MNHPCRPRQALLLLRLVVLVVLATAGTMSRPAYAAPATQGATIAYEVQPGDTLVAIAQLLTALGLYGKHLGLILAYAAGTIVFCTWNLKGYFDTIPIDLEESAMLDGCGPVQAFLLIALPLARPALATTAILAFMSGWGDFVFASVLVPAPDSVKLAVPALYSLANSMSVPWGYFAAGAIIVIIPTVIMFLFMQRYFEGGLTLGGVKG